jgi:sulfite exporter TauE/SafE
MFLCSLFSLHCVAKPFCFAFAAQQQAHAGTKSPAFCALCIKKIQAQFLYNLFRPSTYQK